MTICEPAKQKPKTKKDSDPDCTEDTIKKNLSTCDGGTNAWDKAKQAVGKDPNVKVAHTKLGTPAETEKDGFTITINPTSNCCDATESLLFELHNVEYGPKFHTLFVDAAAGNVSRDDFAKSMERLEYEGLKRSWETFDKCKAKWGCGEDAESFADSFKGAKDFDDYFKHYVDPDHTEKYRTQWDELYKDAYQKKHGKS